VYREGRGEEEGDKGGEEGGGGGIMPLDDEPPKLLPYAQRMLLPSADVIIYIVECFLCLSCTLL